MFMTLLTLVISIAQGLIIGTIIALVVYLPIALTIHYHRRKTLREFTTKMHDLLEESNTRTAEFDRKHKEMQESYRKQHGLN